MNVTMGVFLTVFLVCFFCYSVPICAIMLAWVQFNRFVIVEL
jgi:hypothetical protein